MPERSLIAGNSLEIMHITDMVEERKATGWQLRSLIADRTEVKGSQQLEVERSLKISMVWASLRGVISICVLRYSHRLHFTNFETDFITTSHGHSQRHAAKNTGSAA